jgi:hypothetical protein
MRWRAAFSRRALLAQLGKQQIARSLNHLEHCTKKDMEL